MQSGLGIHEGRRIARRRTKRRTAGSSWLSVILRAVGELYAFLPRHGFQTDWEDSEIRKDKVQSGIAGAAVVYRRLDQRDQRDVTGGECGEGEDQEQSHDALLSVRVAVVTEAALRMRHVLGGRSVSAGCRAAPVYP